MIKGLRWLLLAAVPCLLFIPSKSFAVVTGANPSVSGFNNTSGFPVSGLNNVGIMSNQGASCVYLGNNWVLTAYHVVSNGSGGFVSNLTADFGGNSYNGDGDDIRLNNPANLGGQPTDIVLFQLSSTPTGLSNVTIASSSPAIGTNYYNAGFGLDRSTALEGFNNYFVQTNEADPPYQGYGISGQAEITWGENFVYNVGTDEDPANTIVINAGFGNLTTFASAFVNSATSDQIVPGDSGGGVFNASNQLIGMNDAEATLTDSGTMANQNGDTQALLGDDSYLADLATYSSEINSVVSVPEPTSTVLLAAMALPLLARRRRTASV